MATITKTPFSTVIPDSLKMKLLPRNFSNGQRLKFIEGALFLLAEMVKEKSHWQPYIDILPESVGITQMFSEDEMEQLKGSMVGYSIMHITYHKKNNVIHCDIIAEPSE